MSHALKQGLDENFANYFFKTKANKFSIVLKCTCTEKQGRAVKSNLKVLRHFKVDPVLKIYETVYKHAEPMSIDKNHV